MLCPNKRSKKPDYRPSGALWWPLEPFNRYQVETSQTSWWPKDQWSQSLDPRVFGRFAWALDSRNWRRSPSDFCIRFRTPRSLRARRDHACVLEPISDETALEFAGFFSFYFVYPLFSFSCCFSETLDHGSTCPCQLRPADRNGHLA